MSLADLVRNVCINCGRNEMVVRVPATRPMAVTASGLSMIESTLARRVFHRGGSTVHHGDTEAQSLGICARGHLRFANIVVGLATNYRSLVAGLLGMTF